MLSAAAATELLQRCHSATRLSRIAVELGFVSRSEILTSELREQLALPRNLADARLVTGAGTLRALLVEVAGDGTMRDTLSAVAQALAARTPHCLWLVLGCSPREASVFVAAWQSQRHRPLVRALLVDRHHVYPSDAETLCALAATGEGADVLIHTRWLEILGRDSLTRRFYKRLAEVVHGLAADPAGSAASPVRLELALLNVSRLLFLAFIQSKGWLNRDHSFLQNVFDGCMATGGRVHARVLEPLFFGTLNTRSSRRQQRAGAFGEIPYLNGGLFARSQLERIHRGVRFSDAALGTVFGDLLARWRFTPREEAADWSEAAVDPEILGRAFESLMQPPARSATGVFYTPAEIVERATELALRRALATPEIPEKVVAAALQGSRLEAERARLLLAGVERVRLLDPACGSGAFLVHALRVLADLQVRFGGRSRSAARAAVLAQSIYGVDVNPTAVWLCQLRLWLCLAVECPATGPADVPPLPNLDRNIRVGDSLSGGAFGGSTVARGLSSDTRGLRARYVRAQGPRKRTLAAALDRAERRAALADVESRLASTTSRRREILTSVRSRDLFGEREAAKAMADELRRLRGETAALRAERQRLRQGAALPFSFPVHFADAAADGGFGIVLGNPPWVRPHKLPPATRSMLRSKFAVARLPAGGLHRRPHAFGGQVDLAAPFVERSLDLLRPGGTLALLLPAKLWSSIAGAGLRRHVFASAKVVAIEDFSATAAMFAAVTYPSLVVLARDFDAAAQADVPASVVIHRRGGRIEWSARAGDLRLAPDELSPWLLVPPAVRRAFDTLGRAGTPLARTRFGAPRMGVKTGCNEAFVVSVGTHGRELVEVRNADRHGWVERALLRTTLRGEQVRPWRPRAGACEYIIWTHDAADRPLVQLPPHASRWLRQWRRQLGRRTDARSSSVWWQLFRTPAARTDQHRVVWCDIGRAPRALVLEPGDRTVPLNTCYVSFADEGDAWALAALLNSPLAAAWLNVLGEPARGGYRRYFSWTVAALPVPGDDDAFRGELAPLGRAAAAGADVTPAELLEAALRSYRVRHRDVAPLLEWLDV